MVDDVESETAQSAVEVVSSGFELVAAMKARWIMSVI